MQGLLLKLCGYLADFARASQEKQEDKEVWCSSKGGLSTSNLISQAAPTYVNEAFAGEQLTSNKHNKIY